MKLNAELGHFDTEAAHQAPWSDLTHFMQILCDTEADRLFSLGKTNQGGRGVDCFGGCFCYTVVFIKGQGFLLT